MVMTSLTWNYETSHKLVACGIDTERVDRFSQYVTDDEYPMPFVFSREEVRHFRRLINPEKGFCAAFCSKEAFFKAVSSHYNFPECELFLSGDNVWQKIKLSSNICKEFKIDAAIARINFISYASYLECLAAVYLFKEI
jgi:phosphopantetheinyl transferase (holo-ACP synthase)